MQCSGFAIHCIHITKLTERNDFYEKKENGKTTKTVISLSLDSEVRLNRLGRSDQVPGKKSTSLSIIEQYFVIYKTQKLESSICQVTSGIHQIYY